MPGETIRLIDPQGEIRDVPIEAAGGALDGGWKVPTSEQEIGRVAEKAREVNYGGVAGGIKAGAAAVARGATLGLSDVGARALGGDDAAIALEGLRRENPGVSIAGEVIGGVAPALISGGASLPAGAVARAGRTATGLGAEAGALGKVGAAAAGGALEGALFGAGAGVSELALSQDPLTVERIASTMSSHALFGAGVGGVIGGAAKGAELGLRRAKGGIDRALERRAAKARTPEEAVESGDLSTLNTRALDKLEKAELGRITKEQAPQRKDLVDQLDEYRNSNRDAHALREVTAGAGDRDVVEAGASFTRADIKLRQLLDDRIGLADDVAANPIRVGRLLRQQRQSLAEINVWADEQRRLWQRDVANAPAEIRAALAHVSEQPTLAARAKLAKELGLFEETGPFTEAGLDLATERVLKERMTYQWGGAIRGGLKEPTIVRLQPEYQKVLDWNLRFQQQLDDLSRAPVSDRLSKIEDARAVLDAPKQPEVGLGAVVNAVAPFAGPVGVAAAAGNRVIGSFKKLAEAATTRAGKAASAFLGVAAPATYKAAPVATRILSSLRYGESDRKQKSKTLPELFEARTREVKEQAHIAADGTYQMRPEARAKMAAKFDGIRAADPRLADQLETAGARRIAYLASIMPRLPDMGMMPGLGTGAIAEFQMRSWARAAKAIDDPDAVFERAVHGDVMPEEVAAIRAVWPGKLQDLLDQVVQGVATNKTPLTYEKRFALSMLTGKPFDPALHPAVLNMLQGQFANDEGRPATQAPTAAPAMGSVKKSAPEPTPAQRRAQGGTV